MKTYSRVYEIVDLDAIRFNMEAFRKHVSNDVMLCAVIKTDGYGLGAVPIAKTIADLVWGFAVATIEEALNLRKHKITQPILVLGYVPHERYREMVQEEIRFAAYQEEDLCLLNKVAKEEQKKAWIHIKTDTGMGRIGLQPKEVLSFAKKAADMDAICIEGLFSHLATADMQDRTYAWKQAKRFKELVEELENEKIHIPICHLANSAAAMEMPEINGRMDRIGISLYGYYPSEEMDREAFLLKPAMELKSTIIYKKTVEKGSTIGYGATYCTQDERIVATVPVGYGDGYPRSLSNKGYMLVNGKRAPILGRVCMDQIMIDITDIPDAEIGSEVTLIGKSKDAYLDLEELAELSGRFNYEFLCDLGKRVPRIYYRKGQIVGSKDYFEDFYPDMN